jgi:hypothetical protein
MVPVLSSAAFWLNCADTTPTTLPRSSTKGPPEFPGWTGNRLRENAVQLARQDAREIVSCFGQMGTRRLAAGG